MTLVIVTGVGTDVGKTHVTAALCLAWGRDEPVLPYKPIETGVVGDQGPDEALLASYATFHVKQPLRQLRLRAGVSPHLAARVEGVTLDLASVVDEVVRLKDLVHLVVELPGGLFSPLSDTQVNADLVKTLDPDLVLLVAPNRLGVLHDVRAVYEACQGRGVRLDGVVLDAAGAPDASASTNAAELARTSGLAVLADLPRASIEQLAASGALRDLVRYCQVARSKTAPLE